MKVALSLLLALIGLTAPAAPGINNVRTEDGWFYLTVTNGNAQSYYSIQWSTNLIDWNGSGALFSAPSGDVHLIDVLNTNKVRFYRIVETPTNRLTVANDPSNHEYRLAVGGSSNVVTSAYRFHANHEGISLQRLGLRLYRGITNEAVQVTIWNGATQVGSAIFTGGLFNVYAVCAFSTPVFIPKDQYVTLTIKVNVPQIGLNRGITDSGFYIGVDYDVSNMNPTIGTGVDSGQTFTASGEAPYAGGPLAFKSLPTFIPQPISVSGLGDGRLLRFAVSAHTAGDVSIGKWSFLTTGTEAELKSATLHCFTDSSFSQPITGVMPDGTIGGVTAIGNTKPFNTPFSIYAVTVDGNQTANQTAIVIPAGQIRYFELRGVFAQPLTPSSVLSTSIWTGGDSGNRMVYKTYPSLMFETGAVVWSPNSQGRSSLTDQDWYNSWLVPGLTIPYGISQTRVH